jgi:DNA polymerase-3 subunit gamma/tau
MPGLIRALIAEFRHLLVARVNPELLARDLAADDAAAAQERAQTVSQARLVRGLRLFGDALGAARTSGNARLELETAMLRFILQNEDPTLEALAARLTAIEGGAPVPAAPAPPPRAAAAIPPPPAPATKAAAKPVPVAAPAPAPAPAAAASGPLTAAKLRGLWQNVRARAESEKPSMAATLSRATIEAVTDDLITLRMPDTTGGEALKRSLDTLVKAVEGVVGRAITVRVVVGGAASSTAGTASDPATDGEFPEEHPDDVARYAFDRLL